MVLENIITNDYIRAFVVLLIFLFIIRVILFLLEKFLLKITSKTKTDIDDILVARSSKPLTFLALLIALIISVEEIEMTEALSTIISNILHSLIIIIVSILIYIVIDVVIIRAIKKVASKTKSSVDDSLIALFHSVLRIALVIIVFLYILSLWGVQITPLLAGLGIAGLAVALALQPILSNIFSGAAIVLDHSVRVGDLIYLDQVKGKIEKIGLRSTKIRTFDNELIILPNNKVADSAIQNVALPEPKSRVVIPFSVAYGSKIEKVKKVVLDEIKQIKHSVNNPEPLVRFIEMANSSLNFKAYFYVDSFENRFTAIDEANTRIYNALNKAGIEIPFPQLDVHMKK